MIQYEYHPAPGLFCEKWCPQFTKKTESKKHITLPCTTCISLRWHYPNQVSGQDYQVYSQPISLSSLFRQYHIAFMFFCKALISQLKSAAAIKTTIFYKYFSTRRSIIFWLSILCSVSKVRINLSPGKISFF